MKIVKILGGLGNQMFQYALAVSLKSRFPSENVKIDVSCFRGYHLHNGYELEAVFGIKSAHASFADLVRIAYPYSHYRFWQIGKRVLPNRRTMVMEHDDEEYDASVLDRVGDVYYDGYWQNEKYFIDVREKLVDVFTPVAIDCRNRDFASKLSSCASVSLHVRRGDYSTNPLYGGICTEEYYASAIREIQSLVSVDMFCVFSNDINWCREHLPAIVGGNNIVFVDWNTGMDSYKDMYLMSACRHNIIANSSFSWWGAWLNLHEDKIVMCPRKWNNIKDSRFELPSKWQKV